MSALAATTTVGYGVLVYSYAVLLRPMELELGVSRTVVAGGQTVTLLAGGLSAVFAGRWLDRRGGRALMVAGSVLATGLVFAWSRVDSPLELYLVTTGLGVASAGVLYEAAFAVVLTFFGARRRGTAILAITIVGGFASTIFFPLTGFLVEASGWRQALVWLAVLYGVVTIPLHLLVRRPRSDERPDSMAGPDSMAEGAKVAAAVTEASSGPDSNSDTGIEPPVPTPHKVARRAALHDRSFWLIGGALIGEGAANATISLHLVAYLTELGHRPTFAASIAGLLGVLSVTGRLVVTFLQRKHQLTRVVGVIFAIQATGAAMLPAIGGSVLGAVLCILAFGIGMGVATITKPLLIAERYSLEVYASLAGILAGIGLMTKAFAPLGAAVLHGLTGGYVLVMAICAASSLAAATCLFLIRKVSTSDRSRV